MNDQELDALIDRLDTEIDRDGALLRFVVHGDPADVHVEGNRNGYLRFGVEMLKTAVEPVEEPDATVPVDIEYLTDIKSDIDLEWFVRTETQDRLDLDDSDNSVLERIVPLACLGVVLLGMSLACVGLYTVLQWLF